MRNRTPLLALLTMAAGSGLLATAAIADPLDDLNALRAANGLPAGIVENPAWSAGCALHMRYLALNDFEGDWHTESPARPGYTAAGLPPRAARCSPTRRRSGSRPNWEDAPFHFAQLLAPKLSVTGFADGCMYTWPGYQRPEPAELRLYSYPGDGARGHDEPVPVRLRLRRRDERRARSASASLTGPGGPVAVRIVDNHTPGVEGLLPPGGIVIPDEPLERDGSTRRR